MSTARSTWESGAQANALSASEEAWRAEEAERLSAAQGRMEGGRVETPFRGSGRRAEQETGAPAGRRFTPRPRIRSERAPGGGRSGVEGGRGRAPGGGPARKPKQEVERRLASLDRQRPGKGRPSAWMRPARPGRPKRPSACPKRPRPSGRPKRAERLVRGAPAGRGRVGTPPRRTAQNQGETEGATSEEHLAAAREAWEAEHKEVSWSRRSASEAVARAKKSDKPLEREALQRMASSKVPRSPPMPQPSRPDRSSTGHAERRPSEAWEEDSELRLAQMREGWETELNQRMKPKPRRNGRPRRRSSTPSPGRALVRAKMAEQSCQRRQAVHSKDDAPAGRIGFQGAQQGRQARQALRRGGLRPLRMIAAIGVVALRRAHALLEPDFSLPSTPEKALKPQLTGAPAKDGAQDPTHGLSRSLRTGNDPLSPLEAAAEQACSSSGASSTCGPGSHAKLRGPDASQARAAGRSRVQRRKRLGADRRCRTAAAGSAGSTAPCWRPSRRRRSSPEQRLVEPTLAGLRSAPASRSEIRSSILSMPTERRTRPSEMPSAARALSGTEAWVMIAGVLDQAFDAAQTLGQGEHPRPARGTAGRRPARRRSPPSPCRRTRPSGAWRRRAGDGCRGRGSRPARSSDDPPGGAPPPLRWRSGAPCAMPRSSSPRRARKESNGPWMPPTAFCR